MLFANHASKYRHRTATAHRPPQPIPFLTAFRYLRATAAGQRVASRLASLIPRTVSSRLLGGLLAVAPLAFEISQKSRSPRSLASARHIARLTSRKDAPARSYECRTPVRRECTPALAGRGGDTAAAVSLES
ncbi:hypothetical protein [Haladaptatus litoreus]|uniref:hypothetical protein n=1 Tax=Haladaptatus litoreus TaxID=553468 RepID=UPI0011159350|nr:hypothetical protein [Haladaptatus litoreus]